MKVDHQELSPLGMFKEDNLSTLERTTERYLIELKMLIMEDPAILPVLRRCYKNVYSGIYTC